MNCGGTEFEVGQMHAKYGYTFDSSRMSDQNFWGKYKFGQYQVEGYLCLDCGFIHNFATGNFKELKEKKGN